MSAIARILIVDDSSFSRRHMRQHLEAMGHTVEEATDGNQALERLYLNPPDLLVLDLVMPGIGGMEVLLKARAINAKLPVIIATSDVQKGTMEEAKSCGASALINKPISRPILETVVKNALAGGSSSS